MAEETNSQRIARQRREAGGINAGRTDGAPKVLGYSRFRQGPAARNFSNLDAFYANQRGAPSSSNPAFAGLTADEVAMEMKRRGETTGAGGTNIIPDTRMPPRTRPANGAGQDTAPDGLSGPGNDVPLSDTTGGYVNTPDQQDPFKNVKPAGAPAAPPAVQPVDSSTMRQPMGRVGMSDARGALDAAGNPASESNPAAGTPAELRQMARDAAMGRTVNTVGATGLTPSATGGRPTQAPDFRRMITSKYGTGTNVAREPGQGPATTKDLMGRTVPLGQYLADQKAVQATKDLMGRTVPLGQYLADQKAVQATKYGPDAAQAGEGYFKPATPANNVAALRAKATAPRNTPSPSVTASSGASINRTIGKMEAPGTGTIGPSTQQFGGAAPPPAQSTLPMMTPSALPDTGTIKSNSQQFGAPAPTATRPSGNFTPVESISDLRKRIASRTPIQEDRQEGQMPNEAYANDMSPDQNLSAARDHYAQTGDDSRLRAHFQSYPSQAMQHLQRAQAADERGGRAIADEEYQQSQSEKASQSRDRYLAQQGANAFTVGHHSAAWARANPQQALDLGDRQSFAKEKTAALRDAQTAMGDYGRQFEEDRKKRKVA